MRSPTVIDLSSVPLPAALETIDFATMRAAFISRFVAAWNEERQRDATLPAFDIGELEANPVAILARAFSYLRLLDRQRVNDVVRAVLATTSTGTNLDAVVARQSVQRLVLFPANASTGTAAVMESDAALLRRYLLSFDRGSAGSADRYLFEAWTAWPQMGDARINGHAIHGRRGDTDIVITGPNGRDPTPAELKLVRDACTAPHVAPEAVSVSVIAARRALFAARLAIEIPPGPDASIVRGDVVTRATSAALARTIIGGEVPAGFLRGIAFGNTNVITVEDLSPVAVVPDPYAVPVMTSLDITVAVRA